MLFVERITCADDDSELIDSKAVGQVVIEFEAEIWREVDGFDFVFALQSRTEFMGILGLDGFVIERDSERIPAFGGAL